MNLRNNDGKTVWDLVRKDFDSELLVEYLTNILSYGISGEDFDTASKWDENESESEALQSEASEAETSESESSENDSSDSDSENTSETSFNRSFSFLFFLFFYFF